VPEPALLRRRRITYSCRLRSLRELRCITARFRAPRRQLENVIGNRRNRMWFVSPLLLPLFGALPPAPHAALEEREFFASGHDTSYSDVSYRDP
jgi:hypothetical protein